jgi:hypothetical protein
MQKHKSLFFNISRQPPAGTPRVFDQMIALSTRQFLDRPAR